MRRLCYHAFRTEYSFDFDRPYEILSDADVMNMMRMSMGLADGTCTEDELARARQLVPKRFVHYIDGKIEYLGFVIVNMCSSPCMSANLFGKCERGHDLTPDGFVPILPPTALKANQGVGSANIEQALVPVCTSKWLKRYVTCINRGLATEVPENHSVASREVLKSDCTIYSCINTDVGECIYAVCYGTVGGFGSRSNRL